MQWRKHLPPNCPPNNAGLACGQFYRLIHQGHDSPCDKDFLSKREEEPNKECPSDITECQFCGISIYSRFEDIQSIRKKIPFFRKNKKIAVGTLSKSLGKILHTPSSLSNISDSHHTWWIPENAQPWNNFEVITDKARVL